MTVNQTLKKIAFMLRSGKVAISEAETLMEDAIHEHLLIDDPEWLDKYWKLKRKTWRLLLFATCNHDQGGKEK